MRLHDLMPRGCSRQSIFVCYASEDEELAAKIAQRLEDRGHRIFFDKSSLRPSEDYDKRIEEEILAADWYLFLASRNALAPGRYTHTELGFAKKKWPSAVGHVVTAIIENDLGTEALPPYLSGIQAIKVSGDARAEISAEFEKLRKVSWVCWCCFAISTVALAGVMGLAFGLIPIREPNPPVPPMPSFAAPSILRPSSGQEVKPSDNEVVALLSRGKAHHYLIVTPFRSKTGWVEAEFSPPASDGSATAVAKFGGAGDCGRSFTIEVLETAAPLPVGPLVGAPQLPLKSPAIKVNREPCSPPTRANER